MGQEHALQEINKLGGSPQYEELEEAIGSSPQTIRKTLIHLERQGIITIERPRAAKQGRPTWKGARITERIKGKQGDE
jgi:Mn-dependent DtxR family transcriptional regulator